MALSRTARILVALLLLAAAAFFWVNFFTQNTFLVDAPAAVPGVATQPVTPAPTAVVPPAEGDAVADAEGVAAGAEPSETADAAVADEDAGVEGAAATEAAEPAAEGVTAPAVVTAPVVVIDAPVTLSRNVVVADLPFLITSPPVVAAPDVEDVETDADAERRLASARATVNPFSPVVVRVAAAPAREVPTEAPVITEVAVPSGPAAGATAAAPPRVSAPAPQVRAPAGTPVRDLPRALPTGVPLSATPDLLRQPRAAAAERVDVSSVATIRLPEPEPAPPSDIVAPPRVTSAVASTLPEVLGPGQPAAPATVAAVAVPTPPLAAGTNVLSRYLRDNGYIFTGSALGPVSVGVFRSHDTPTPVVVAIGQSLPDTDIVLTDLRGQQAQLTLGDTSQILVLDLRR